MDCNLDAKNTLPFLVSRYWNTQACIIAYGSTQETHQMRAKRDFLHILASPGYAPGTIAVNVIWMERGFNAGQSIAA